MQEIKITIGLSPSLMAIVQVLASASGISLPLEESPSAPTSTPIASPTAPSEPTTVATEAPPAPVGNGVSAGAAGSEEVDSAGTPYDPARHAGSKGKTKDGLWRMKVGVSRPEGEGKPAASATAATGSASPAPPTAIPAPPAPSAAPVDPNRPTDPAFRHDNGDGTEQWYVGSAWDNGKHPIPSAAPVAPVADIDDEFAQFASAATDATPATPGARTWTDADLSKLCNQAALAAGGPDKVKPIIAKYMPEGVSQHSRHVPDDKREEFAKEVEAAHGITYAA